MHFLPFKIRVVPRTLQFKQPAGTSRGIYYNRKVWYIVITSSDPQIHFTGLGECAPLHDLSCDYDEHYEQRLRKVCAEVEETQNLDVRKLRHLPSMLFGLQSAFRSAAGSLGGDYLRLYPSAFTRGEKGIPINGLVWMGSYDEMCQRMEDKLEQGFRCVKLKIGAIDFESEMELIRQLRSRYSKEVVELRVDANGGFTPSEAPRKLDILAQYDIHSIEQPIKQGQWKEMAHLCANTPLPIALDEELIGVNDFEQKIDLLDTIRPQFIVLKPTLHGAFTGAGEWMSLAKDRNIGYWTTSALESNVGLNAIAQWCAAIDPDTPLPQGLGTGQLFVENFDKAPLHIEGDCLWYGSKEQRNFLHEIEAFKQRWQQPTPTMQVHTSGSTGQPKSMKVEKVRMWDSALTTLQALGLQEGNTALLCMPLRYIAGQMMLVRSFAGQLQLIPVAPTSHPYAHLHEAPDFAALTPMQVFESLKVPHERSLLRRTLCLIIGGGAISDALTKELKRFPNPVYSTYGMTETLSHIALRRLNGPTASDAYTPLPGVDVSLSSEGCLCIYAPQVNSEHLITNDLAEILPNGSFRILGRRDNVICSGGIKMQIEEIEQKLSCLHLPLQITALPHDSLGEAITLLYSADKELTSFIKEQCHVLLDKYEMPRHIIRVDELPLTETGKPARAQARQLAIKMTMTTQSDNPF